jgi:type VI secretion system secreted protein Hcp
MILLGLAVLAPLLVSSISFAEAANVDYFLKIPDIEGESTDAEHGEEIDVLSWSWGETNNSSHDTNTAGKQGSTTLQDLTVVIKQDKSSPKLMQYVADGKHISDEVVLTARKITSDGSQQDYFIIKMKPVYITSYQTGGSSGDVVPVDTISLNFGEIKFEYKPLDPTKPPVFGEASHIPGHR